MSAKPYLSIVMTSRNDNHGGDVTNRMRHCFRSMAEQSLRTGLPVEAVIVDWNPPPDREPLSGIEGFPRSDGPFTIRYVTVPAELHRRIPHGERVPLYQYIAKNVGIARATGEFIVGSNIDIVFADSVFDWFATRPLRRGVLYRADRWDVDFAGVPYDVPDRDRQRIAPARLTYLNLRDKTHRCADLRLPEQPGFATVAALVEALNEAGIRHGVRPDQWHTNACGDFTLMSAEDWRLIEAYPEWPIHSWHIDSVFLAKAKANGIVEGYLGADRPLFHIDHGMVWGGGREVRLELVPEAEGYRIEPRRPALPILSNLDLARIELTVAANKDVTFHAVPSWGMADIALPETSP